MYQVAVELGVTHIGINLNQSNVRTLAGRPSGQIAMSDLWGKSAGFSAFALTNRTVSGYMEGSTGTITEIATIWFNSNGQLQTETYSGGIVSISGEWATPLITGEGSKYQLYWTKSSGTTPTSNVTAATWTDLGTSRYMRVTAQRTTNGSTTVSCVLACQVRRISDSVVVGSANITLQASVYRGVIN